MIESIRKELGLIDTTKYTPNDVNSFYFLDRTARAGTPKSPLDFETLFKNHFNLVITTNHMFKLGYFLSQIHKYPARTSDFAILFSLWAKCTPGKSHIISHNDLKVLYEQVMKINNLTGNFDEFVTSYSLSKMLAPVIIFDGRDYHFDYGTLFIILFYIFSLNKQTTGLQNISGFVTLNTQRAIVAKNFEKLIREKFQNEKFDVYPQNNESLIVKALDQEHEFDFIAIDHSLKLVVLGDAKYQDMTPSSIAGDTIFNQVVLDSHDGLLKQSIEQEDRKKFFITNYRLFPSQIADISTYKIVSIIVTKHVTIFHKYKTTRIMPYGTFVKQDFRNLIDQ